MGNNADRGKQKYSERHLSHRRNIQHKTHTERPGIEHRPPQCELDF